MLGPQILEQPPRSSTQFIFSKTRPCFPELNCNIGRSPNFPQCNLMTRQIPTCHKKSCQCQTIISCVVKFQKKIRKDLFSSRFCKICIFLDVFDFPLCFANLSNVPNARFGFGSMTLLPLLPINPKSQLPCVDFVPLVCLRTPPRPQTFPAQGFFVSAYNFNTICHLQLFFRQIIASKK